MKKSSKLILAILIIFIFNIFVVNNVFALTGLSEDLNVYKGTSTEAPNLISKAEIFTGMIRTIGIVLAVVCLIIIGIKYMLGSVEEKAEYKKTLLPYVIGAFLLFTGSLVPQIIYLISQNIK